MLVPEHRADQRFQGQLSPGGCRHHGARCGPPNGPRARPSMQKGRHSLKYRWVQQDLMALVFQFRQLDALPEPCWSRTIRFTEGRRGHLFLGSDKNADGGAIRDSGDYAWTEEQAKPTRNPEMATAVRRVLARCIALLTGAPLSVPCHKNGPRNAITRPSRLVITRSRSDRSYFLKTSLAPTDLVGGSKRAKANLTR